MARVERTATTVGNDTEKLEPSYIAGENVKWYDCFGKSGNSSKRIIIKFNNSTLKYVCKKNACNTTKNICLHKHLHTNVNGSIIPNNSKVKTVQMPN